MLCSPKLLVHYDPEKPLVLTCDASPYGIGGHLAHNCQSNLNDTVWVIIRNYNASGKWIPSVIVSRTGPVSYVIQVNEVLKSEVSC